MKEDFLHYIWQYKRWNPAVSLQTTTEKSVEILSSGTKNPNAGPDFLNAKIIIDGILWVGNVEIHVKSSDWILHHHQEDKNYENLILHVVYIHDLESDLGNFPTLEFHKKISKDLLDNYQILNQEKKFIPCENLFHSVDDFVKNNWLENLFIDRIQQRTETLENRLQQLNGDFEALFFERLSLAFGLKINATAFEILAKSFPFSVLRKLSQNQENIEALLLGQAGFLEIPKDEYQFELKMEYDYLKHKFQLQTIDNSVFKFFRLHPNNFPTVRIAQLSAIYKQESEVFQSWIKAKNPQEIQSKLNGIECNKYWDNHFSFGKISSKNHPKKLTEEFVELLIINALLPIKFLYSQHHNQFSAEEFLDFTKKLKPEKNKIIQNFEKIGAKSENAFVSQAFLELYKNYCTQKKCLNCPIGNQILNYSNQFVRENYMEFNAE